MNRAFAIRISARIWNSQGQNKTAVQVDEMSHTIEIRRSDGRRVAVSGGQLLFLALGTCYRNDLYKQAERMGITLDEVAVVVEGELEKEGDPFRNIVYRASVTSDATDAQIRDLLVRTDSMAEVPNTLRAGTHVELDLVSDRP